MRDDGSTARAHARGRSLPARWRSLAPCRRRGARSWLLLRRSAMPRRRRRAAPRSAGAASPRWRRRPSLGIVCVGCCIAGHRGAGWGFCLAADRLWLAAWTSCDASRRVEPRRGRAALVDSPCPSSSAPACCSSGRLVVAASAVPAGPPAAALAIGARFASSLPTLGADFGQTFLRRCSPAMSSAAAPASSSPSWPTACPSCSAGCCRSAISSRRCRSSASRRSW